VLNVGVAKKVTIYLNEDTVARHDFLCKEIFDLLLERGAAGATVIYPRSGFGSHHRVHQSGDYDSGEHVPVRIEFIDSEEKVAALLPVLLEMVTDGMIEAHDTTILKAARRDS
jgi:hypothetical protein